VTDPSPSTPARPIWQTGRRSPGRGEIKLRLPAELDRRVRSAAELSGLTLTRWIARALARELDGRG
jgi:predicted HicB family RNase H-like nuclease